MTRAKRQLDGDSVSAKPDASKAAKIGSGRHAKRATSSKPSRREANEIRPEFAFESVEACARAVTAVAVSSQIDAESVFRDAQVHFLTSDKASWVYHVPHWYRRVFDAAKALSSSKPRGGRNNGDGDSSNISCIRDLAYSEWFDQIWALHPDKQGTIKMYGRDVLTPRFQQAYDMSVRFSGNTFDAKPLPDVLQHCVRAMQAMLANPDTGESFLRGTLLNWYANGDQYIGPHDDSDKKLSLFTRSPVFSLSLGATRRFVFTAKATKTATAESEETVERLELELQDGDLVVMGGTTQLTHKHALPKMKKCRDKRVNITLRCFKD